MGIHVTIKSIMFDSIILFSSKPPNGYNPKEWKHAIVGNITLIRKIGKRNV